ncbi:ATP-binding cassette domain-containing protein [Lachnotalea sp. AF33-28]|nr:ATP-binding cassette domain-containing protein [Lachnotalea sp. AF33-28]
MENIMEVQHLKKYFPVKGGFVSHTLGYVQAVDDISFTIKKGRVLGLVGESGCGKSTVGRTILGLTPATEGKILFEGEDIAGAKGEKQHEIRRKMQIVFQDPYSSLDPRMTVYDLISEGMVAQKMVDGRADLEEKVNELMLKCGLFPEQANRYPHQFSGGQRQRISIARALATRPEFVVCDEAVSALDVSIQAQIINLLKDMQEEMGLTYLFISHDLSIVRFISDDVAVMYLGQIVEMGTKAQIFDHPAHPYTQALLSAAPAFTKKEKREKKRILLEGDLPTPYNPPKGCRFAGRCPYAKPECQEVQELTELEDGHMVMCRRAQEEARRKGERI